MKTRKKSRIKNRIELFKSIILIALAALCAVSGLIVKKYVFSKQTDVRAYPAWNTGNSSYDAQSGDNENRFWKYTRSDYTVVSGGENRSFYTEGSVRYESLNSALNTLLNNVLIKSGITGNHLSTSNEWTDVLSGSAIYMKLPCLIKINEISALSGVSVSSRLSSAAAFDELALTYDGTLRTVVLYFRNSSSGEIQKYITDSNSAELEKILNDFCGGAGKNCVYGFELASDPVRYGVPEAAYGAVSGLNISSVVPVQTFNAREITAHTPDILSAVLADMTKSAKAGEIIGLFGLNTEELNVYCGKDGVKTFEDDRSALNIYPDGKLEFLSSTGITNDSFSLSDNGGKNAFTGVSDIIARLCATLDINFAKSGAELKLSGIDTHDSKINLKFDYRFDGIPTDIADAAHAAEATVSDGRLTELKIYLKNFDSSQGEADSGNAFSAIEGFAAENPNLRINNVKLCYSNVTDGALCRADWAINK